MQCRTCGSPLPTGASSCPSCGSATPYNQYAGGYEPTQRAGDPIPPTSYGSPPPPPSSPGVGSPYPYGGSTGYNTPSQPSYPSAYPTPQTPSQPGYAQPGYQQYNAIPPTPNFPQFTPPPKKNNMTIIIASVAAVVVIAVVIGVFASLNGSKTGGPTTKTPTAVVNTDTTPTPKATPTPKTEQTDPTAAAILSNLQTASAIDDDTAAPTELTSTFTAGNYVYITFDMDLSSITPKGGIYGYVHAKFYDGSKLLQSDTLKVDDDYSNGYFGWPYDDPTDNGKATVYWCTKSDCSDAKLAQTVTFTVTY